MKFPKEKLDDEFPKEKRYEFFYFPIFLVVVFLSSIMIDKLSFEVAAVFGLSGCLHIFASNVLTYLYNWQRVLIPFVPKSTPKRLKILGVVLIIFGGIQLVI